MDLRTNIRRLREAAKLTQDDVATALEVDRSTVSQWETGWSKPRMGRIEKIAELFGVPVSELVSEGDEDPIIPLTTLGRVHAGEFSDEEKTAFQIEVPASLVARHPDARAVLVEGTCMNRVIPEGAAVVYDPTLEPTNGRIVIAETADHAAILRRWNRQGNRLVLSADSYDPYDDIVITGDDPITVLGTVVWMQCAREL